MKYILRVYGIQEIGGRKNQEDSTYPKLDNLKDTDRTFVLCDGMGGHDAGEVASATVCETMGNYILNDGHDGDGMFTDEDLKNAIAAAFSALDKKDSGAEKKMGTTMTFLKLHNNGATIAHMGDSRVYHIRPGKDGSNTDFWATEDHSLVNDLIKIGELTKKEARTSKQKNVITRAMQPNMERKPKADIKHITDIKGGDFFYMCSDGMLEQEEMENGESIKNIFSEAIPSVDDKVTILKKVTENNRDNHTALIIHILEVEGSVESQEEKGGATSVPSIGIGVVEDDDVSEESTSSEANTPSDKSIDESGYSSESNPKKFSVPKSKPIFQKMILRFVIAAFIVAICIVGINYIPSCSEKKNSENIEQSQIKQGKDKRNDVNKRESRNQASSQAETHHQEQAQEIALDAANSNAAQAATGDAPQQSNGSNGNTAGTIQVSDQAGVVSSDQQVLQEALNQ